MRAAGAAVLIGLAASLLYADARPQLAESWTNTLAKAETKEATELSAIPYQGITAIVNNCGAYQDKFEAQLLFDGSKPTTGTWGWNPTGCEQGKNGWYVKANLGQIYRLTGVTVYSLGDSTHDPAEFTVYGCTSADETVSDCTAKLQTCTNKIGTNGAQTCEFTSTQGSYLNTRYVLFNVTSTGTGKGWQPYMRELTWLGSVDATLAPTTSLNTAGPMRAPATLAPTVDPRIIHNCHCEGCESHAYINHFEVDVSGCADLCDKEAYCKASLYNSKNTKCYLYPNPLRSVKTNGENHFSCYVKTTKTPTRTPTFSPTPTPTETPTFGDCKDVSSSTADAGHTDTYRGWYDVQGCGKCNDYCRWVGDTGSGGDPSLKLTHGSGSNPSWWSCRLAGTDDTYSKRGYFDQFKFKKCSEQGADDSNAPTAQPTANPTRTPTADPTIPPTRLPTVRPTAAPTTRVPTILPSESPTKVPTAPPTNYPTLVPSMTPTMTPTDERITATPSTDPSWSPTLTPDHLGTAWPSYDSPPPTDAPTYNPSVQPTRTPTAPPTHTPTSTPTIDPTEEPTYEPTLEPTSTEPTAKPSSAPTREPTLVPTAAHLFTVTNRSVENFGTWCATLGAKVVAGDMNGDGKGDLACCGVAGWQSMPTAFGDGAGAYAVTNHEIASFGSLASAEGVQMVSGDFDGDGKTDVALSGAVGWGTVPVAFSLGNGTYNVTNVAIADFGGWASKAGAQLLSADFNGDGIDDLALVGHSGWDTVPVAFAEGTQGREGAFSVTDFKVSRLPSQCAESGMKAVAGDFNGDGKGDIVCSGHTNYDGIPTAFGKGDGQFNVVYHAAADFPSLASQSGVQMVAGDFNGDGLDDLALAGKSGWATISIATSNGDGQFGVTSIRSEEFSKLASAAGAQLVSAQFNTDEKADLALAGGSGWDTIPTAFSD